MANELMREMLKAGVHFGHQTRFWNPKMRPYIYGERNKIHIINLEKTLPLYQEAVSFLGRMASNRGRILFVGTKSAAQEAIAAEATRCNMPYVDRRWLGGMLTNFRTIKQSIKYMDELENTLQENVVKPQLNKRELLQLQRKFTKLNNNLGGIKNMESLPDVLFVIDVGNEKIAVSEAVKLGIPVVGVVDTNHSPQGVDYVIPGNDDAIRSIKLYLGGISDAILEGLETVQAALKQESTEIQAATGSATKKKHPPSRKASGSDADSSTPKKIVVRRKRNPAASATDSSDATDATDASDETATPNTDPQ